MVIVIMKKKAIYLIILIGLIFAILKIYSFQPIGKNIAKVDIETQQASSNDRYIVTNKSEKTYREQSHTANVSGQITYEEFIVNDSLVAINTDAIPYLKYVRETNQQKAKKDATLEKWELAGLTNDKEVRSYKIGKILEQKSIFENQEEKPNVDNPFGQVGRILATSRTIAKYDSIMEKNLAADEAWILAHERTLSKAGIEDYSKARIDKVQKAMWKLKGATNFEENFGTNDVAEKVANNLYQEAVWLKESIDNRNKLEHPIVDNKENEYGTENAGVVSYNQTTKEFLVGPFSINYARDIHEALPGGLSEMISVEEGTGTSLIYSDIIGARIYGLVNGKEQLLSDWEFVYNDVTLVDNSVERNAIIAANKEGINLNSIYPYPNEEFFIKFLNPNNSIQALTKIEFDIQTLNAEGTAKELKGTYSNVNWVVGEEWNRNTHTYSAFVEDKEISRPNAATLYQIENAKVYLKVESVKIKVGNKNTGYKYSDYCIPLTMDIGGTVWVDGDEYAESRGGVNGIKESTEERKSGVGVKLYNEAGQEIGSTTTNQDGKYLFNYVQVGPKYYVEFEYDWMKYKTTKELNISSGKGSLTDFIGNPENYLNSSHASENEQKRKDFNQEFYEITTDKSVGKDGSKIKDIKYTYENNVNPYYQVATVQEFRKTVTTKESEVLVPFQDKFSIVEGGGKFFEIGVGERGSCAITTTNTEEELSYLFETGAYMKVQEYLKNINLGLVERCPADFQLKSDIVSTTFTLNEDFSSQIMGFESRKDLDIDVNLRDEAYVNKQYLQNITTEEYNWRHDFTETENGENYSKEEDELQLYVLYEYVIKNNSPLISGYITELSNFYDKEYMYPVNNDSNVINYYSQDSAYAEYAMEFMKYPSYVMKDGNILKQVNWKTTSKFGDSNNSQLNKMYTESLKDILLLPGEEISVYVYYKVNREEININTDTEYKYGNYIITDNSTNGKRSLVEINAYRSLDYVEKDVNNGALNTVGGSRVDVDSNPGNVDSNANNINNFQAYEDDTEQAPLLRVVVNSSNGKEISGYVWEDLRTVKLGNNQWVGNSKLDENEEFINDVCVELIRLEYNPNTGKYEEVKFSQNYLNYIDAFNTNIDKKYGMQYANGEISKIKIVRRSGPQEDAESITETEAFIADGQYRFINLIESGQYKVRFLYGDEEQFTSSLEGIKYNGHDYKTTEFNGFYDQQLEVTDLNSIYMQNSAVIKILSTSSNCEVYSNKLQNKLASTYGDFEIDTVMINQDINAIVNAGNELISSNKNAKILVLLVDKELPDLTSILGSALANDITVIVVASNNINGSNYNINYNDKSVVYFDTLYNTVSVIKVYNRIVNDILKDNIFTNTLNCATEFIENKSTLNGDVYGRIDVMLQSQTIDADMAKILNIDEILNIKNETDRNVRSKKVADRFKMSAESYPVSVMFDDNMDVININLGLQKIPESSLEVSKEVYDIDVKLNNGTTIIDYRGNKVQNLQHFPNESYNIYMDKEIMQGATIEIQYKINISNIGEVDNLNTYLKYYPYDVKKAVYSRLIKQNVNYNEAELEEILNQSITVTVNDIYDYYDNLNFETANNNRNNVHINSIAFTLIDNNWAEVNRNTYEDIELTQGDFLNQYIEWKRIDNVNDYKILEENKDKMGGYRCINTINLNNLNLYPFESIETRDNQGFSSVSVYVGLIKSLAEEDFNFKDALEYNNYVELIETYSINGRRDKDSSVGNFIPSGNNKNNPTIEKDSDFSEVVRILPPFGASKYIAYGSCIVILIVIATVIIVYRKKLNRKANENQETDEK